MTDAAPAADALLVPELDLEALLPQLRRIAYKLAPSSRGAYSPDDLLQHMLVSALENWARLAGQTESYVRAHCAWQARMLCRAARRRRPAGLDENVAAPDADPAAIVERREDLRAVRCWAAQVLAGARLTAAAHRHVLAIATAPDRRRQRGRPVPGRDRTARCNALRQVRERYPHPLHYVS